MTAASVKPDENVILGESSFIIRGEFSDLDRRKHRILDTLFKALEKRGGKAKEGDRGILFVEMQGEKWNCRFAKSRKRDGDRLQRVSSGGPPKATKSGVKRCSPQEN